VLRLASACRICPIPGNKPSALVEFALIDPGTGHARCCRPESSRKHGRTKPRRAIERPDLFAAKNGESPRLIAGATGTGKTVTVQTLAEDFSALGIPVFMADFKGDLAGLLGGILGGG
jgi:hypothetical protein